MNLKSLLSAKLIFLVFVRLFIYRLDTIDGRSSLVMSSERKGLCFLPSRIKSSDVLVTL